MSKQRAKGTAWETAITRFLAAQGFPQVERRALAGTSDRGDIAGIPGWVLEAKNCQRTELGAWVDEAAIEQANDGAEFSAVWHHRRGKANPADGFVTVTGATFVRLLRQAGYGEPLTATQGAEPGSAGHVDALDAQSRSGRDDHPHSDPGDGRKECDTCGKWVFEVTHSCKGIPVTGAALSRWVERQPRGDQAGA